MSCLASWMVRALGLVVAGLLTAGLVVGSQLPYAAGSGEESRIRLSWRAVGERVEECREPTAEELASLPLHMRQRQICAGRILPFRLIVRLDGAVLVDTTVRGAGAREDRPAYVLEEFRVTPGEHRLEVRFEVEAPEGAAASPRAPLLLDRRVEIGPGRILLVTTDDEGETLRVLGTSAE